MEETGTVVVVVDLGPTMKIAVGGSCYVRAKSY